MPEPASSQFHSDTSASTLTLIFYELARHPDQMERLRQELLEHLSSSGEVQHRDLQYLDYLNGVIFETLRLYPPVPTAPYRKTPPEGIKVGDTYVPGNATVFCPQYIIGRSKDIYCCVHVHRGADSGHLQAKRFTLIPRTLFPSAGILARRWSRSGVHSRHFQQVCKSLFLFFCLIRIALSRYSITCLPLDVSFSSDGSSDTSTQEPLSSHHE